MSPPEARQALPRHEGRVAALISVGEATSLRKGCRAVVPVRAPGTVPLTIFPCDRPLPRALEAKPPILVEGGSVGFVRGLCGLHVPSHQGRSGAKTAGVAGDLHKNKVWFIHSFIWSVSHLLIYSHSSNIHGALLCVSHLLWVQDERIPVLALWEENREGWWQARDSPTQVAQESIGGPGDPKQVRGQAGNALLSSRCTNGVLSPVWLMTMI